MIKYDYYYAPYVVCNLNTGVDPFETHTGYIFFGIRLHKLLLEQGDLYKRLGYSNQREIWDSIPEGSNKPSFLILNSQADACRLGVFREYEFELEPMEMSVSVAPFNDLYKTYLPVGAQLRPQEVIIALYGMVWTFRSGTESAGYRVRAGSIKERRSKRTAPRFA